MNAQLGVKMSSLPNGTLWYRNVCFRGLKVKDWCLQNNVSKILIITGYGKYVKPHVI